MHQPLIIQHLFQVSSLEEVSRERLESFVESHPSFGIGHYLLSRKLQAEGADRFQTETQRTCLYFSNPLWLQWQLDNEGPAVATQPAGAWTSAATEVVDPPVAESVVPLAAEPAVSPAVESALEPVISSAAEPVVSSVEASPVFIGEPEASEEPIVREAAPEIVEPAATPEEPVENVVTMAEEAFNGSASGDDLAEALSTGKCADDPEEPTAAELLLRSIEEAKGIRESLHKLNDDFTAETAIAGETLPEETPAAAPPAVNEEPANYEVPSTAVAPAVPEDQPLASEEPIHDVEGPFVLDEADEQPAEASPADKIAAAIERVVSAIGPVSAKAEPGHAVAEPIRSVPEPMPAEPAPAFTTPERAQDTAPEKETQKETEKETSQPEKPGSGTGVQDFLFEPYHTIDYFASQGIKLTLDENPADKLGKQLKSFTEWLKTMRRLPQKDREVVPDRVAEEAVQTSAAHSIEGKDVDTETMAEVLAKQGMREKARAVYEKLSLLNPDKRAYFASKIEQLNIP